MKFMSEIFAWVLKITTYDKEHLKLSSNIRMEELADRRLMKIGCKHRDDLSIYRQTSYIAGTLVGNIIVDH